MKLALIISASLLFAGAVSHAADDNSAQSITYKLSGLYCESREDDLREALREQPAVRVKSVSYMQAEATLEYDPGAISRERLDKLLKPAFFEIKRVAAGDDPKLVNIVIPVVGLDCKGCCFAAYGAIAKIDGVEQATACFKQGRVTAWIDPAKTNRAALEDALKKRGVTLLPSE